MTKSKKIYAAPIYIYIYSIYRITRCADDGSAYLPHQTINHRHMQMETTTINCAAHHAHLKKTSNPLKIDERPHIEIDIMRALISI